MEDTIELKFKEPYYQENDIEKSIIQSILLYSHILEIEENDKLYIENKEQ